MADIVLNSEKREAVGKNKVNKLRQQAIVPGVVYAKDKENKLVHVEYLEQNTELPDYKAALEAAKKLV